VALLSGWVIALWDVREALMTLVLLSALKCDIAQWGFALLSAVWHCTMQRGFVQCNVAFLSAAWQCSVQ